MAVRTISTRLAIEGEAEYRNSVREINSELNTLGSELKLVESNFKGQANSQAALIAKGEVLKRTFVAQSNKVKELDAALKNAQNAQQAYNSQIDATKAKISQNDAAMDKLKVSTLDTTEAQRKLAEKTAKLQKELEEATAKESASQRAINDWQRQVNVAQTELNALNSELKQNDKYLDEAKRSTDKCATSIDNYGKQTEQATEKSGLLQKIFAGGFLANIASNALSSLGNMLKSFATAALETADELKGLTAETGLSSTELQKLRYIGEDVGVSVETMATSMKRIVKSMNGARDGTGEAAAAYKKLGITITEANGELRDGNTVFGEVLSALSRMTNETERDAVAQTVLGRSATELNALIELGADGMKELGDQAETTGAIMSEDAVDALDATGDAIDHAKQSAQAFVGEALAKIISGSKTAAESMGDLTDELEAQNNIDSLIDKYRQLTAEVSDSSTNSAELSVKTAELEQVKQDLIAVSGGVVTALGLENGAFDSQVNTLDTLTQAELEYNRLKLAAIILDNTASGAAEKMAAATKKQADAKAQLAEEQAKVDELTEKLKNGDKSSGNEDELDRRTAYLKSLSYELGKADEELVQVSTDINAGQEAAQSLIDSGLSAAEAADMCGKSLEEFNAILSGTSGATAGATTPISDLEAAVTELQTAYNNAYIAAYASLDGQIAKWQEMDNQAVTSAANVLTALQSQIDWLANYQTNLDSLEARKIPGVDTSELIQSLSDGSTESAAILAGLATATDAEVSQIVASMSKVSEGKENLSGEMAAVATDFAAKMDEMSEKVDATVDGMNNCVAAGEAARDTMNGYIKQAEAMIPNLKATFAKAGREANQAYRDAQESKSPSKKAMKATADYFDGLINQAKTMTPELESTFSDVANKANLAAMTAMPSNFGVRRSASAAAQSTNQTVKHEISGTLRVEGVNDAGQLMGSTEIIAQNLSRDARRFASGAAFSAGG